MGLSGRPRSLDDVGEPNAQPLVSGDAVSKVNSVKNSADAGAGEDLDVSGGGSDESVPESRWRRDADLGCDQNGNREEDAISLDRFDYSDYKRGEVHSTK